MAPRVYGVSRRLTPGKPPPTDELTVAVGAVESEPERERGGYDPRMFSASKRDVASLARMCFVRANKFAGIRVEARRRDGTINQR